jgi:hypothetical protein
MLKSHPLKRKMTIRLEPLLKESLVSADSTPTTAAKLKAFVAKISQDTGIKIEYGDECLERDNWALEILEDKSYAEAITENMKNSKDFPGDLFSAVQTEYKKNKNWEDDHQVR